MGNVLHCPWPYCDTRLRVFYEGVVAPRVHRGKSALHEGDAPICLRICGHECEHAMMLRRWFGLSERFFF